jgi:hypothetical protein
MGILIGATLQAQAADRYVRQGASGTGSGSDWTNAYTTLPGSLTRGDTYYIADGTYSGYTFDDANSGTTLITIKKATVASHGTNTGWSEVFGDGVAAFTGQINFTTSNWVFDGVVGGGPDSWTSGHGFKVTNMNGTPALRTGAVSSITMRHVEMVGNDGSNQGGGSIANDGLAVYGGTNITLSHYYIHDMGRCIFFLSTQNFVAEYGYTGDFTSTSSTHAELASIWNFVIAPHHVTFRYNVFAHIEGTGGLIFDNVYTPTQTGMEIYGNVFYRPSGDSWDVANGVIGGWTGGNGEEFHNVYVYNNTFINMNQNTLSTFPRVYSGNVAKNNLWYNSSSPSFGTFATHDYNHFINSGGAHSEANGTSAESGDPFVDYLNLNFRLKAPTATGAVLPAPYNVDMYGTVRGANGVWNQGAAEFSSGPRPDPPRDVQVQ